MRVTATLMLMILLLGGCAVVKGSGGREIEAHPVKETTVIDNVTGRVTIVTTWRYDDGVQITTEDRFDKDTKVEDRRATSRAPIRTVEIP